MEAQVFIGPRSDELVQPKQGIITDALQKRLRVLPFLDSRTKLLHWKGLRYHETCKDRVVGALHDDSVDNEPHALGRHGGNLDVGHLRQLVGKARSDRWKDRGITG